MRSKILALSLLAAWAAPAQAGLLDALLGNDGGGPLPANSLTAGMRFEQPVKSEITLIVKRNDEAPILTVCDLAKEMDGRCPSSRREVVVLPFQLDDSRLKPGAATRIAVKAAPWSTGYASDFSKMKMSQQAPCDWSGTLADLAKNPMVCEGRNNPWGSPRDVRILITVALGRPVGGVSQ